MIIFKGKTPVDCIQSDCVGVTGDNIAYTQEFYIKGISDESITYTIHLRFSDGSVNSVIPDVVVADGEGTAIRWIIKENDIFKHGYFEVQLEGRNKPGLVWQTEIVTLYADESLPVEDKAYENPNSETLKLRQEAYEMLKKLEEYDLDNKADKATTLSGYGITDAYTKTEADNSLANKADKATTLEGYGITDTYTKSYIDKSLNNKQEKRGLDTEPMLNSPNYLTSGTVYTALQKKADKSTASELQTEITSLQNSLSELSNMIYANEYAATLVIDDDGTTFSDNNGDVMLADWKLKEA